MLLLILDQASDADDYSWTFVLVFTLLLGVYIGGGIRLGQRAGVAKAPGAAGPLLALLSQVKNIYKSPCCSEFRK